MFKTSASILIADFISLLYNNTCIPSAQAQLLLFSLNVSNVDFQKNGKVDST